MPLELSINLLTSIAELLRLSFLLSIPMFFGALTIKHLASFLQNRFSFSFFQSTVLSTYVTVLVLIIVLYFYPFYFGFQESSYSNPSIPPQFAFTTADYVAALPQLAAKFFWNAAVFALLLLPLEFLASYAFDSLKKKEKLPKLLNIYLSIYVASIVTVLLLLFVFPFALTGLIYFLYFT